MESMTSDASSEPAESAAVTMTDVDEIMASRKSTVTGEPGMAAAATSTNEGNNNSLPKEISYAELELLKKLEEQNR